jgi:hypothetical protein
MNHVFRDHLISASNPVDSTVNWRVLSQTEVSALSPRVAFLDHQRSLLTLGNSHLKQRIAALAQDKIFKDGDLAAIAIPIPFTLHA